MLSPLVTLGNVRAIGCLSALQLRLSAALAPGDLWMQLSERNSISRGATCCARALKENVPSPTLSIYHIIYDIVASMFYSIIAK